MFEMKDWCKQLANAITCNYTDFKNISGQDLEELGKWVDIKKDLAEMEYYESEKFKNISIIEAMDKTDITDQVAPDVPKLAGYNNRRYASGRYAPAGRGSVYGYIPEVYGYMYDESMTDPSFVNTRRMGYDHPVNSSGSNIRYSGNQSYGYDQSKYGKAYDKFDQARKFYAETKDPEHHKKMNDSVGEVMDSITNMLSDMWKDMDPEQKTRRKEELIGKISRLPM